MKIDIRSAAAKYYDLDPDFPADIPFYLFQIPTPGASVLELGCGTGRVILPLSAHCGFIQGIDLSPAMVSICRKKLAQAHIPPEKARVEVGDITCFDLGRRFDLIIAPYRVLQNLESDADLDGLFACIRSHLAPGGTCILNVFNPFMNPQELREKWVSPDEIFEWEVPVKNGRATCSGLRASMDPERLVLYPKLIYRRYEEDSLQEEAVLDIAMRCYYPDTFEQLVLGHGYSIVDRWGGYHGEPYGEGPELVLQFTC